MKQKATLAKSGLTSLATAAGCMCDVCMHVRARLCVLTSLCARVCVCQDEVTWLLSWAAREDPALCCQSTNKNHKRWTTMLPGRPPLPLAVPLSFLCLPCPPPAHPCHTYTHLDTQWHSWPCQSRFRDEKWSTAGPALRYQLPAMEWSSQILSYPYSCEDRAS